MNSVMYPVTPLCGKEDGGWMQGSQCRLKDLSIVSELDKIFIEKVDILYAPPADEGFNIDSKTYDFIQF